MLKYLKNSRPANCVSIIKKSHCKAVKFLSDIMNGSTYISTWWLDREIDNIVTENRISRKSTWINSFIIKGLVIIVLKLFSDTAVYLRIEWLALVNTLSSNTIIISIFDTINLFLALFKVFDPKSWDSEWKTEKFFQEICINGFKTFLGIPSLFPLLPSITSMRSICRQAVSGLAISVEFSQ